MGCQSKIYTLVAFSVMWLRMGVGIPLHMFSWHQKSENNLQDYYAYNIYRQILVKIYNYYIIENILVVYFLQLPVAGKCGSLCVVRWVGNRRAQTHGRGHHDHGYSISVQIQGVSVIFFGRLGVIATFLAKSQSNCDSHSPAQEVNKINSPVNKSSRLLHQFST